MDIDKDFLPHIFNDDIIYVIADQEAIAQAGPKASHQVDAMEQEQTDKPATTPQNETSTKVQEKVTGYASKKVLLLLAHGLAEKEETLLQNILKAVGLTENDISRIYEHPSKFSELKGTQLMLSFHSNFAPEASYELNNINGIQVIYAHDLSDLDNNISYKKQLWANLKQIKL